MFESAMPLIEEYRALESQLSDPALHADAARSRRVGRRYAALRPVVEALDEHARLSGDREAALELAETDAAFADEVEDLESQLVVVTARLTRLLAPRDANDDADALLEIKSGEGGDESALFAGDLLRMYLRHAEHTGWKVQVLDEQLTDLGGYKSVTVAVKGNAVDGVGPYGRMKFEGGVHRVQRAGGQQVDHVADPAHVLEDEPVGMGQVDVRLLGAVQQQDPAVAQVPIGHQFGRPGVDRMARCAAQRPSSHARHCPPTRSGEQCATVRQSRPGHGNIDGHGYR